MTYDELILDCIARRATIPDGMTDDEFIANCIARRETIPNGAYRLTKQVVIPDDGAMNGDTLHFDFVGLSEGEAMIREERGSAEGRVNRLIVSRDTFGPIFGHTTSCPTYSSRS